MRTALTAAMVVPSTMFKVYDPPNSETLVSKLSELKSGSMNYARKMIRSWSFCDHLKPDQDLDFLEHCKTGVKACSHLAALVRDRAPMVRGPY